MKSKKRKLTQVAVLVLAGLTLMAAPAAAMRGRAGGGHRGMGRGMGPAFTDEQQEQIKKIHAKYGDERAELTNRLKVIMVEAHDVDAGSAPDYGEIENNIEEVAKIKVKLAKLRLQIHKEVRPLLNDDQRVLFDRNLGGMLHGGMGGSGHPGMMGRSGGMRSCEMMGRGGVMGCKGAKGGHGMGGMSGHPRMMGRAMGDGEAMPWCPFADDADDE